MRHHTIGIFSSLEGGSLGYYFSCTLWVKFENIYYRTKLALVTQIHSDKRYEQICLGGMKRV